ncbi:MULTISPECIES: D-alanyl-D-alanine carboxypeptidase family protein [Cysteiniphilum]|uniref:serine-type D-Ala-D-Ala carboxypeptidase n=1 Tax=Cysteiniphilum litorale TaxID=2056700 RepID=A0A8J3E990_9GAMM|nr:MULTISPECIES: D-alanyl-D-alanine carboxypeptidase family protein [Cysteiniphilum]GGG01632.1 D-alanyl-D-alanine carboxypeptidase [Cysteiniphilum litorale]
MQLTYFKKILFGTFIAIFAFAGTPALSIANTLGNPPVIIIKPHPIQLNAASWLLMDFETGDIIADHNMHEKRAPASLTKIMTAYIIAGELNQGTLKLDQTVKISETAAKTPGSKMFVKQGSRVSVDDLLKGMIIQSGNDAAVALAEFIAGSDSNFVNLMNKTAKALGMNDTNFATVDGLPGDNQYTTAYDMAILARSFIEHYPKVYKLYSEKTFTFNGIVQHNRNKLLRTFEGTDGIKTGYTEKAGYNLVASAVQNNQRYISVILGSPSAYVREQESEKLLNFGFSKFADQLLYTKDSVISLDDTAITDATKDAKLTVIGKDTITKTIPKSFVNHLTQKIVLLPGLKAPINKGQKVGTLVISAGEYQVIEIPVYANNTIERAGFFSRWFG